MKRNIDEKEFSFAINKHEVEDVKFIAKRELKEIVNNKLTEITPWFGLILRRKIDEIFEMASNFENIEEKETYPITNFL